jgi:hypothetical protein
MSGVMVRKKVKRISFVDCGKGESRVTSADAIAIAIAIARRRPSSREKATASSRVATARRRYSCREKAAASGIY